MTAGPARPLEIRNLHKSYGALEGAQGRQHTPPKAGHVVSMIRLLGSGKSTLLRCANLLGQTSRANVIFCRRAGDLEWAMAPTATTGDRKTDNPQYPHESSNGVPAVQPSGRTMNHSRETVMEAAR